jgi:LuxR family maltose regulon positive regulatory protein
MPMSAPAIRGNTLVLDDGQPTSIVVGTPQWFAWLSTATSFSFMSPLGRFSARKDSRAGGKAYWKAYRTRSGQVYRAYLGRCETLTLERLNDVARTLATLAPGAEGVDARRAAGRAMASRTPDSGEASLADGMLLGPLLMVKAKPPPVRPHAVDRPRLLRQLDDGLRCRLTLISAPAGFGKTTLLSQWAGSAPCRVAWLSLDHTDNDWLRFWSYVVAALQTVYPDAGQPALTVLRALQEPPAASVPALLANELLSRQDELVLVLDDYQRIYAPAIHRGLSLLLDYLPAHVHVFISTREDPPLPLPLLRARAELLELRGEQLALTHAEADAFLNSSMGKGLAGSQVTLLYQRTEGWVTGLQLAALSIQGPRDVDAVVASFAHYRNVMDYLTAEVLQGQPEQTQRFLLRTSILDHLCASLCDALLDSDDSQQILEALERSNLFTLPLDSFRNWYRYHSLFARSLRLHLQARDPQLAATLHRRASQWYLANDMPAEAIAQAMYVPDHVSAATVIERTGPGLLMRHEFRTLVDSIVALPEELVRSRPRLCLYRAEAELFTSHWEMATTWLQYAEAALGNQATTDSEGDAGQDGRAALRADLDRLRLAINAGRGDQLMTLTHFYASAGRSGVADEGVMAAPVQERAQGTILRAASCALAGRLHEAFALYQRASDLLSDAGLDSAPIAGDALSSLGMVAYEWNELHAAELNAVRGVELCRKATFTGSVAFVCMQLALIRFALGAPDDAFQLIGQAGEYWRTLAFPSGVRHAAAYRVLFTLRQGNARAARRMVLPEARSPDEDSGAYHHLMRYHGTVALAQAACGQLEAAQQSLDRALAVSAANGWVWSEIHSLAARATLEAEHGQVDEALSVLARALSLAQAEGFVRSFLDCGPTMENLLRRLRRRPLGATAGISPDYLYRLLAAFRAEATSAWKSTALEHLPPASDRGDGWLFIERLTPRESQVVQLMLAGAANREIATRLVVAVSTVKRHINHIFGKLNVHNRVELLRLAQDLKSGRSG